MPKRHSTVDACDVVCFGVLPCFLFFLLSEGDGPLNRYRLHDDVSPMSCT